MPVPTSATLNWILLPSIAPLPSNLPGRQLPPRRPLAKDLLRGGGALWARLNQAAQTILDHLPVSAL
ncbi:MAG: hypothetical protein ACI4QD_07735 [Kiritimatiellia bacterium]